LYKVSNLGNVKSLERYSYSNGSRKPRLINEKILAKCKNSDNYLTAHLNCNGKASRFGIHILVANAFIPKPGDNKTYEVNHKDFNRHNNCVDNLEWVTHIENIKKSAEKDRYKIRNYYGENNPNYANNTLRLKYAMYPDLKMKCALPRELNGRAKKIRLLDKAMTLIKEFSFIGECAEYLINSGIAKATVNSIRGAIRLHIKNNKPYLGYYFKYI